MTARWVDERDTVTITISREDAEVLRQIEWALPYNFAVALQAALGGGSDERVQG